MSELNDQNLSEQQTQDPNQESQQPANLPTQDVVQLSRAEYAQMATQIAVLQNQLESLQAQSQQQAQPAPFEGKDINQLTNAELLQIIQQHSEQQQQQILNTVMQIAIKEEIRDLGDRYPEFKSDKKVRDEVFQIAEKNTHLSLEQAFLLSKGMKPAPQATPNPAQTPPPSQRDSVSHQTVVQDKPMSVREAAEAALKAIKYTE